VISDLDRRNSTAMAIALRIDSDNDNEGYQTAMGTPGLADF
jgi:hypothetical protein